LFAVIAQKPNDQDINTQYKCILNDLSTTLAIMIQHRPDHQRIITTLEAVTAGRDLAREAPGITTGPPGWLERDFSPLLTSPAANNPYDITTRTTRKDPGVQIARSQFHK
jgi:hypothetical protein